MDVDLTVYVAAKQAPEEYPVSRRTLDFWMRDGKLTPHKFPRDQRTYLQREELAARLAEARTERRGRPRGSGRKQREGPT